MRQRRAQALQAHAAEAEPFGASGHLAVCEQGQQRLGTAQADAGRGGDRSAAQQQHRPQPRRPGLRRRREPAFLPLRGNAGQLCDVAEQMTRAVRPQVQPSVTGVHRHAFDASGQRQQIVRQWRAAVGAHRRAQRRFAGAAGAEKGQRDAVSRNRGRVDRRRCDQMQPQREHARPQIFEGNRIGRGGQHDRIRLDADAQVGAGEPAAGPVGVQFEPGIGAAPQRPRRRIGELPVDGDGQWRQRSTRGRARQVERQRGPDRMTVPDEIGAVGARRGGRQGATGSRTISPRPSSCASSSSVSARHTAGSTA
ncbi:MAG: hypothetical protein AMXMBFR25_30990 [Lysobacterales bacterium]